MCSIFFVYSLSSFKCKILIVSSAAMFDIREEFHLQSKTQIESLVVAIGLIGAMIITTFIGSLVDTFGRRKMLIASSIIYFLASIFTIMISSIHMLMCTRLVTGFGIGLAMTIDPLYISEISPASKRGSLNTFPQLSGSSGMCFSYFLLDSMFHLYQIRIGG